MKILRWALVASSEKNEKFLDELCQPAPKNEKFLDEPCKPASKKMKNS